jgi:hypothetical protein
MTSVVSLRVSRQKQRHYAKDDDDFTATVAKRPNLPRETADGKAMKRWQLTVLLAVLFLGIGVPITYRLGARLLEGKILEALGPSSRLTELRVNWFSIEVTDLSIDAPKGWPAPQTLQAERVTIIPDLRSLISDRIRISSIVVHKPTCPCCARRKS